MSKLTSILIFTTGFLGGSVSTYFALKKRFDILLVEEIKSVKETYEELNSDKEKSNSDEIETVCEYEKFLPKEHNEYKKDDPEFDEPYLIPPTEFNEIYGYETATLTLYSDGIVADEYMEVVDDVDIILGKENLQQLRDGEADCVYIRNDSKYCDYEVLRDYGTFEDEIINHNSAEEDYE